MTTTTDKITAAQARRFARSLQSWGFYGITIVEEFPSGDTYIKMLNACGMTRYVRNQAEFIEMREEAER